MKKANESCLDLSIWTFLCEYVVVFYDNLLKTFFSRYYLLFAQKENEHNYESMTGEMLAEE